MPNLRGKTLLKRVLPIFFIIQRTADRKKEAAIKTFIKDLLKSYGETSRSNADVGLKAYVLAYAKDIVFESNGLSDCEKIDLEAAFRPVEVGSYTCTKAVMDRLNNVMSPNGVLVDFYYIPKVFWFADEIIGERDVYDKIRGIVSSNEFISKSNRNVICSNWEKRIDFSAFTSLDGDLVNAFPYGTIRPYTRNPNSVAGESRPLSDGSCDYQSQLTEFIKTHPLKTEPVGDIGTNKTNL